MHPYLTAPDGGQVDACSLRLPARTRVPVDGPPMPCGAQAVEGTAHDLHRGPRLEDLVLDDAYTDLDADEDGRVRVLLTAPDGRATQLWTEGQVGWLQVFTGDTLTPRRRSSPPARVWCSWRQDSSFGFVGASWQRLRRSDPGRPAGPGQDVQVSSRSSGAASHPHELGSA